MAKTATKQLSKKEAILQAALSLFAERGFHGTAVPLVAERAGVGTGTVYRYFGNKEELANELYRRWKRQFATFLLSGVLPGMSMRDAFHSLWERMLTFYKDHPEAFSFLDFHHHGSYLDTASRTLERDVMLQLRAFVVEGQRQKALKQVTPELLMAIAYGGFLGLARAASEGHVKLTAEAVRTAENAMWDALSP